MREPRFGVLDTVAIVADDPMEHGREGVVTQVRRYRNGEHRYVIGWMSDRKLGGVYPEHWLVATGRLSSLAPRAIRFPPTAATSVKVSESGDLLHEESYEVVAELA